MMPAALGMVAALCSPIPAQDAPDVYVYHDPHWFHVGYLDAPKSTDALTWHRLMSHALCDELGRRGVHAEVIGAEQWASICEEARRCIVVDIGQSVPGAIYHGQDEGSPLERWLEAGGILCYAGDWFCHWYALEGGERGGDSARHQGDDDICDANLVRDGFVGMSCEPTEAAEEVLPAFEGWRTLRPFDADAIEEHCPWHEVYGTAIRETDAGRLRAADPVAFQVPGGQGYVFACRLARSTHTDSAQMILDFILSRGLSLLGGERP
ncbi:MAG: hypothetical protein U9R79_14355 [Armatimonadota bacterium]|nr:hypothetical protein [Armatimonadota bacterium]